jgi:hypothetical protein
MPAGSIRQLNGQKRLLIHNPVNNYLILISDSIMVPCYGRNTAATKGCVIIVFVSERKVQPSFDTDGRSIGQESLPDEVTPALAVSMIW